MQTHTHMHTLSYLFSPQLFHSPCPPHEEQL